MFDRSAITEGRLIQEFGLCDLKGVYQNTAKLRSKGFLAVLFFDPADSYSTSVADTLQGWATSLPGDKVAVVGVGRGERDPLESFVTSHGLTYITLWDFEDYTAGLWGVTQVPTLFITDARGLVLWKIVGDDQAALAEAKKSVEDGVQKLIEAAAAAKAAEEAAKAAAAAAPPPAPAPAAPPAPAPAPVAPPAPVAITPALNPLPTKAEAKAAPKAEAKAEGKKADKGEKKKK